MERYYEYYKLEKYKLADFVHLSILLDGREATIVYINHIADILNHERFYKEHLKVPFIFNKIKCKDGTIKIKETCPLKIAIESFKNFNDNFIWVTFHGEWKFQFAKFVIRKGLEIVEITRDPNIVRKYLKYL